MQKALLAVVTLVGACSSTSDPADSSARVVDASGATHSDAERHSLHGSDINPRLLRRFKPLRTELDDGAPPAKAMTDLGRMLFFDARLSKTRDISCASCHPLDRYGADGQVTSAGTGGQRGYRNSPTVYHAAGEFSAFWDGRAANVEEQAKGPLLNPIEMGMTSGDEVVARLAVIPGYEPAFRAAFPDTDKPITYENVGRAIGAFERGLVTPSRWDRFLIGDRNALTADELAGFKLFSDIGCMTCHTGELVGGSMFQKVGVVKPWPNQADRGRFEVTKVPSDAMLFKVPSLRDVSKTGPYFHDGSVATLPEAVRMMARYQIGEELGEEDTRIIVAWLGSLTGPLPTEYTAVPALPPDR